MGVKYDERRLEVVKKSSKQIDLYQPHQQSLIALQKGSQFKCQASFF